jgi:hypothetical protein
LPQEASAGKWVGLHYSRFHRYWKNVTEKNQILTEAEDPKNHLIRRRIREDGLNEAPTEGGLRRTMQPSQRGGDPVQRTAPFGLLKRFHLAQYQAGPIVINYRQAVVIIVSAETHRSAEYRE